MYMKYNDVEANVVSASGSRILPKYLRAKSGVALT